MEPGLRETDRWVQPGAAIAAGKWSEEPVLAVGKALATHAKPAKAAVIERIAKPIKSCSR